MFDFFKKDKEGKPLDVKAVRDRLLQFVKEQLQKVEGGEGANIKGMQLYIACAETEKHLYESAVYFEEEDRFRNEDVQRIADDYAIDLPPTWTMEILFVDALPAEALKVPDLDAALFVQTRKRAIPKSAVAYLRILNGEAEQEEYTLTSEISKVNIGREKKVQTNDGFFRINHIAFPASSTDEANRFISRQHAHIQFDGETGLFLLFADEGGVPPRNKVKVRSVDSQPVKLQSMEVGHPLGEGDQIIIGETAVLQFSYSSTANPHH